MTRSAVAFAFPIAAIALAACDDPSTTAQPTPSSQPPSSPTTTPTDDATTPTTSSSDRAVAEQFIAALNDRDPEAAEALVAPGAPVAVSPLAPSEALDKDVTLEEQIAWQAAWDWRSDDIACEAGERSAAATSQAFGEGEGGPGEMVEFNATANCTVTAHTKLGDLDGVFVTHTIVLRLLDGTITYVSGGPPQLRWMPSFLDFKGWAETERTDLWSQAWNDDGPLLTVESAEIERQLIDEYIALNPNDGDDDTGSAADPEAPVVEPAAVDPQ